ncbi:MAG: helix-turn-helix transcriptional regulator [Solirubrobacteraceae bacterium]|nr:helix-turn-helix transcriptional regulator [Solirubrobacteraceae bacterium]
MDQLEDLAGCLRSWRDRLSPAEVGLPEGRARRAPGLRREELAGLAGLSVDYLSRLEQGRASNPSASVLAPLARALRLTDAERDHLYRLAGHALPGPGQINRHITPGLQRVLDRLTDVPVVVSAPSGEMVAANTVAEALIGELPTDPDDSNIARKVFGLSPDHTRFVRTPEEHAALELILAGDLHDASGRFPNDAYLRRVITDLRAGSARFAELWDAHPVTRRHADRKSLEHPQVGRITVDCDRLSVEGSDLTAIVYTATPGSPDADALALVAAIGLQQFG